MNLACAVEQQNVFISISSEMSSAGEELFIISDAFFCSYFTDWNSTEHHGQVQRQLSVSSDSKLLDDDIREESRVIMRPKKPPRPKSEVFLNKHSDPHPRRKRFSAFGVSQQLQQLVNVRCSTNIRTENFVLHNLRKL